MNKTKLILSLILVFLLSGISTPASAQSLKKVLKKHFKASATKKALAVQTVKSTGTASLMGGQMEMDIESIQSRPNKMRNDMSFAGGSMIQAYDGKEAWGTNPMMGPDPMKLPAEQVEGMKQQSYIEGFLYNAKEKGYKVELDGEGKVEEKPTYKLKVTPEAEGSDVFYVHLDKKSFLMTKIDATMQDPMSGQDTQGEFFYTNYKEVGGIPFAHGVEVRAGGTVFMEMTIAEITLGAKVDDAKFSMPK